MIIDNKYLTHISQLEQEVGRLQGTIESIVDAWFSWQQAPGVDHEIYRCEDFAEMMRKLSKQVDSFNKSNKENNKSNCQGCCVRCGDQLEESKNN